MLVLCSVVKSFLVLLYAALRCSALCCAGLGWAVQSLGSYMYFVGLCMCVNVVQHLSSFSFALCSALICHAVHSYVELRFNSCV